MDFDLAQTDALLSTTRAVRNRLDLDREVPDEIIVRCIELAEQAPTGGNQQSRRWIVVRDPDTKQALADCYRAAGGDRLIEIGDRLTDTDHENENENENENERMMASAAHLARNLERVPVLVVPTIKGVHDGSGRPGLFDSVIQAVWSFCLALRARGLGSAWTTIHLQRADQAAEILGIPDDVTQIALIPVAWTIGTEFGPGRRGPVEDLLHRDRWDPDRG